MRGVYEHPSGSKVWWIHYYENGKRHREKIGTKGNAEKVYQKRKAAILEGRKLPELRAKRDIKMSDLLDLLLHYAEGTPDQRNVIGRVKIIRDALGNRSASDITPQELDRWLKSHTKSSATYNRYRSSLSVAFQEGMRNRLVTNNPARLVKHRKETAGRLRFLSYEEYDRMCQVLSEKYPHHLAEFQFSVKTGMRLSEQYTVEWEQYHPATRRIRLDRSKNGDGRAVDLIHPIIALIESLKQPAQLLTDRIFPRLSKHHVQKKRDNFNNRSWFNPALKEAGIENYTWHGNRHTFCSWLAMNGASMKDIQVLAGHKTIGVSARYAHLTPVHALNVLDRAMDRATAEQLL